MDLAVYWRVLQRRWKLVTAGVVVALLLGFFSAARLGLDGVRPSVDYRQDEVWSSASTLFITEEGFPWGRADRDVSGAWGRYTGLAQLYTALAKSDAVKRSVRRTAPKDASYQAEVVRSPDTTLPLIYMRGFGPSPEAAETIAASAARSFRSYLARLQAQNQIPLERRVQVVQITEATTAKNIEPRSMVRPVFVFLLVLTAFVALAFVAENAGFQMPRPPSWRHLRDVIQARIPARATEQPAATMARADEARASSRPAPAEPRTLGEPLRAERLPVTDEPLAEEPPAQVRRWA